MHPRQSGAADGAHPDPFSVIKKAWISGRPIVPLFGAGISAGAGIPLTPLMVDYLAKAHWVFAQTHQSGLTGTRRTADALLRSGWPDPHELNELILRDWERH